MPAKQHRVTRGSDYRLIVRSGRRVGGAICIAHAVLHTQEQTEVLVPAKFGYIISKAVGNAVTRNLVRRRMKAITERQLQQGFTGADVVFRVFPAAATVPFHTLERELNKQLEKVKLFQQTNQST